MTYNNISVENARRDYIRGLDAAKSGSTSIGEESTFFKEGKKDGEARYLPMPATPQEAINFQKVDSGFRAGLDSGLSSDPDPIVQSAVISGRRKADDISSRVFIQNLNQR